jgi:hypothetical protein
LVVASLPDGSLTRFRFQLPGVEQFDVSVRFRCGVGRPARNKNGALVGWGFGFLRCLTLVATTLHWGFGNLRANGSMSARIAIVNRAAAFRAVLRIIPPLGFCAARRSLGRSARSAIGGLSAVGSDARAQFDLAPPEFWSAMGWAARIAKEQGGAGTQFCTLVHYIDFTEEVYAIFGPLVKKWGVWKAEWGVQKRFLRVSIAARIPDRGEEIHIESRKREFAL